MRPIAITLVACLAVACAPSAPRVYAANIDQPMAAVREALLAVTGDALADEFRLPAATAGLGSDGQVVWNIFVGANLAGQLQIKLTSKGASQTAIVATYAPAALSAADQAVPALRDPKTLADILFKALDAQVTALNPQNSPDVVKRNKSLSEEFIRGARIAANPTVIPENVEDAFKHTAQMIEESAPSSVDTSESADAVAATPDDLPPAAPTDSRRSDWKYGDPVTTPE